MTPLQVGMCGCLLLALLLAANVPVAFAMAVAGFCGFALLVSPQAALSMTVIDFYETFASYDLTVIPLFVWMGQLAFHSGISKSLFEAAYHWIGRLPGGLAMSTVGACAGFGAICGSGPATAATIGSVALPEMRRYGYSMELATGAAASGGGLGMLIPPSVVFIVYAILTEQSIGRLFLAGVAPGILITLLFCAAIYIWCRWQPAAGPAAPPTNWQRKFKSLGGVMETVALFALVMGGMFTGKCTPTEGAAVGAGGTLLIVCLKGHGRWPLLVHSLKETIRTSCMVMSIVAGAIIFGHFLAVTQIPMELARWLAALPLPAFLIILLIILFYLVAGCFVDALALVILTVPIFYPVVTALKYDLVWFGVIIVVVTMMGVITPPVGINAYVVSGLARDLPLPTVFKGCLPFLAALIVAAFLLVLFPQICLFLPGLLP